jgi:solute carrier family 25 (mitochondrial S-adenosylmethionine transporter), member 26
MQAHLSLLLLVVFASKSQCIAPPSLIKQKAALLCAGATADCECAAKARPTTVGLSRRSFVASLLTLPAVSAAAVSASAAPVATERPKGDNASSVLQESISGLVAGSTLTFTKSLIKYPLDTATVRLQMPSSTYSVTRPADLFDGAYRGIALPLIANIPAGAVFFAVKDATKSVLRQASVQPGLSLSPILQTCVAVGLAQIPYWIVRNPSEVVKTRQQAGVDGFGDGVTTWQAYNRVRIDALQRVPRGNGTDLGGMNIFRADELRATAREFYVGYWENILYAYPADVVKFVCYDLLTAGRKDSLSPMEGAWAGAVSTAFAQLVTTPLDVVRNRVMCQAGTSDAPTRTFSVDDGNAASNPYITSLLKLAKEEGLAGLFAGATPRVSKAFLSGAIQFATYEGTKQSVLGLLLKQ